MEGAFMPNAQELTGRAAEVYERLQANMTPAEIADNLGVSRNAVYQHIGRLKRDGIIPDDGPHLHEAGTRTRRRNARAHDEQESVVGEVEQLASRMRARLEAIDEQERALTREREQITRTLDALTPVLTQ
jgi:predicted ArsR family transcriptional regulator